jgi:hypothetical protein
MIVAQVGDAELAGGAVVLALAALVGLGALEERQQLAVAPAARTVQTGPVVEVGLLAADVEQPLMMLEPPSALPRGQAIARLPVPGSGSSGNCQEKRGS